jgi:hypothetical protein
MSSLRGALQHSPVAELKILRVSLWRILPGYPGRWNKTKVPHNQRNVYGA